MSGDRPLVSVVMPVRNAISFLDEAVRSILEQSFENFEFVIGDDGSTDGSSERLRQWARLDSRIVLHHQSGSGLGPAMSSDWVARLARAPLVARMDADDISRRDRLQRQVDVLTTRTDAAMVASLWEGIDHRSRRIHGRDRSTLIGSNKRPFVHGTIMYRRAAFERIGGYREHTDFFEDGDLFVRFATAGRVLVLQDPLYLYRWSFGSSRFGRERDRVENAQQIGSIWGSQATPADVSVEQLEIWGRQVAAQRLNPAIFVGMAFPRVWNGRRGETLGRAISRGEFRFNRQSCAVLLWLMASALVPRLLRAVMRFRMHTRDAAAARLLQEVTAIEWPASGG